MRCEMLIISRGEENIRCATTDERDSSDIKSRREFRRVSEEVPGLGLVLLVIHRTMCPIINIRGPHAHKFIELLQVGRGTGFGVLGYLARATDIGHHNGEESLANDRDGKRRKKRKRKNYSTISAILRDDNELFNDKVVRYILFNN